MRRQSSKRRQREDEENKLESGDETLWTYLVAGGALIIAIAALVIGIVALVRANTHDEPSFTSVVFYPNETVVNKTSIVNGSVRSEGLVDITIFVSVLNSVAKGDSIIIGHIGEEDAPSNVILNLCGTSTLSTSAFFALSASGYMTISPLEATITPTDVIQVHAIYFAGS